MANPVPLPQWRPIPLRVLIDDALKLLRRHWRTIYVPVVLPVAAVMTPLSVYYSSRMVEWMSFDEAPSASEMLSFFGALVPLWSLSSLVQMLAYGAMIAACVDAVASQSFQMKQKWLWVIKPRVFGTFLLMVLASFLSALFCFFPVIYVGLLVSFVGPAMVAEGKHGFAALKRSAQLVNYDTRLSFGNNPMVKIFLLFLTGFLLSYVINLVVQLPFIVLQQVILFRTVAEGGTVDPTVFAATSAWIQAPTVLLSILAGGLVWLYMCFGIALLFFDVRKRREGGDLETALDELAAPSPFSAHEK